MRTQVSLLVVLAAWLPSMAWSQDAQSTTQRPSFDLSAESIKRIVHEAAAAQSTLARPGADKADAGEVKTVRFVPAEKPPAKAPAEMRPFPDVRVPSFMSHVLGAMVDDLAGVNGYSSSEPWRDSRARDSLAAFRQLAQTPDLYPPSPVRPGL